MDIGKMKKLLLLSVFRSCEVQNTRNKYGLSKYPVSRYISDQHTSSLETNNQKKEKRLQLRLLIKVNTTHALTQSYHSERELVRTMSKDRHHALDHKVVALFSKAMEYWKKGNISTEKLQQVADFRRAYVRLRPKLSGGYDYSQKRNKRRKSDNEVQTQAIRKRARTEYRTKLWKEAKDLGSYVLNDEELAAMKEFRYKPDGRKEDAEKKAFNHARFYFNADEIKELLYARYEWSKERDRKNKKKAGNDKKR